MDLQNFRLQSVEINCSFPPSPIFWEVTAEVVNSHLDRYDNWGRVNNGFVLGSDKKKIIVRLQHRSISADIESLPEEQKAANETLKSFSDNAQVVMIDTLKGYGYDSVTQASYRYRFFRQVESVAEQIPAVVASLMQVPDQYLRKFDGGAVDFSWNVTFPYGDFWCYPWIYGVYKRDIQQIFTQSHDECGNRGIIASVSFDLSSEKESLSLEGLEALFRIPSEKFFEVAALAVRNIPE